MNEQKTLRLIQAAPDAVVRQGYVRENGRKRLDHVVWSSALLGLESRIDIAHIAPVASHEAPEEQLYMEHASDAPEGTASDESITAQAAPRGRRERKE
jgi:hypothetical protein